MQAENKSPTKINSVYTRDGAFKNLDNFLVDSNGNNVLNADNEPVTILGVMI